MKVRKSFSPQALSGLSESHAEPRCDTSTSIFFDRDHAVRAVARRGFRPRSQLLGRALEDHLDASVIAGAVDDAEDLGRLALAHCVPLTQIQVDHDAHRYARRLR